MSYELIVTLIVLVLFVAAIRDTWKWTVPATIVSAGTLLIMTVLVYPPV